jgi:hypothetical protein
LNRLYAGLSRETNYAKQGWKVLNKKQVLFLLTLFFLAFFFLNLSVKEKWGVKDLVFH